MDKVSEDISTIKEKVDDIKITLNNLVIEQNILKSHISEVQSKAIATDLNLEKIQSEIDTIKEKSKSTPPSLVASDVYESFMTEVREREQRSKNIIIVGIKEPVSASIDERTDIDVGVTDQVNADNNKIC